jgi:hypothetical protein
MTFNWTTTDDKWKGYLDTTIKVKITITKVNANTCAIEFMKMSGNQHIFLEDFAEKRDKTFHEFAIEDKVTA